MTPEQYRNMWHTQIETSWDEATKTPGKQLVKGALEAGYAVGEDAHYYISEYCTRTFCGKNRKVRKDAIAQTADEIIVGIVEMFELKTVAEQAQDIADQRRAIFGAVQHQFTGHQAPQS